MTKLTDLILAATNEGQKESSDDEEINEEINEDMCEVHYVQWIDSASLTSPWSSPQDIADLEPAIVHTVGFLINETNDFITLVSSVTDDAAGGDVTIPKVAIKDRRVV